MVTGFAGLALQQIIPRLLTTQVPLETFIVQIPFLIRTNLFRADQLVTSQAGPLDVAFDELTPFATSVLKQQGVLKRESDLPKELAKVYANVPQPEIAAKKVPAAEKTATAATMSAAKALPVDKLADSPLPLTAEKSVTPNAEATPAAPPVVKKPLPIMKPVAGAEAPAASAASSKTKPPAIPEVQLAELRDFYLTIVRPFLNKGLSPQQGLNESIDARRLFAQLKSDLPAELHEILGQLEAFCDERRQFAVQRRLHRWLHWWLILHIPPSIALLVLFVAHVVVSLRVVPFGR